MNEYNDNIDDIDLALALRRLAESTSVPPANPAREAALMAAFDASVRVSPRPPIVRPYWGMAGLATAAALLIVVVLSRSALDAMASLQRENRLRTRLSILLQPWCSAGAGAR